MLARLAAAQCRATLTGAMHSNIDGTDLSGKLNDTPNCQLQKTCYCSSSGPQAQELMAKYLGVNHEGPARAASDHDSILNREGVCRQASNGPVPHILGVCQEGGKVELFRCWQIQGLHLHMHTNCQMACTVFEICCLADMSLRIDLSHF